MSKSKRYNLDPEVIIRSKCKPTRHSREQELCGHLQSAEVVALVEAGYWPTSNPDYLDFELECIYTDKEAGLANPGWFYFFAKPRKKKWRRKGSDKAQR